MPRKGSKLGSMQRINLKLMLKSNGMLLRKTFGANGYGWGW